MNKLLVYLGTSFFVLEAIILIGYLLSLADTYITKGFGVGFLLLALNGIFGACLMIGALSKE